MGGSKSKAVEVMSEVKVSGRVIDATTSLLKYERTRWGVNNTSLAPPLSSTLSQSRGKLLEVGEEEEEHHATHCWVLLVKLR